MKKTVALVVVAFLSLLPLTAYAQELRIKVADSQTPRAACTTFGPAKVLSVDLNLDDGIDTYHFSLSGAGPWDSISFACAGNQNAYGVVDILRNACAAGLNVYLCLAGSTLWAISFVNLDSEGI